MEQQNHQPYFDPLSFQNHFNNSSQSKYKEIQFLGSGSFAEVYKAISKNKYYAIKKINIHRIKNNPLFRNQIYMEIQIMKKLKHNRIVKLYEVYQTQNQLCLVLQYVPGGSLFDKLKTYTKFSEQMVKQYVIDILDALKYMHSQNQPILHRDLKPQNILLDNEGRCKLADFGSSNILAEGTLRNTYTGTDQYRAPQAYKGQAQDCGVDIWSVGILIYELLVGKVPQGRSSIMEQMQQQYSNNENHITNSQQRQKQLYFPDYLSRSVQDLIKKILTKNPIQRIGLQQIRQHIWLCDLATEEEQAREFIQSVEMKASLYPKSKYFQSLYSVYNLDSFIMEKQKNTLENKKRQLYKTFLQKHKKFSQKKQPLLYYQKMTNVQKQIEIKQKVDEKIQLLNTKNQLKLQIQINNLNINRKLKEQKEQSEILQKQQERWITKIKQYQSNIEILKSSPLKFNYQVLNTFERLKKQIQRLKNYIHYLPNVTQREVCYFPLPSHFLHSSALVPQSQYIPKLMQQYLQIRRDALINLQKVHRSYNEYHQLSKIQESRLLQKNLSFHNENSSDIQKSR